MKQIIFTKSLIVILCISLSSHLFAAPMSGTYRIGESAKNFNNFTEAIDSLKKNGINGAVRFLVKDSTYIEQLTILAITGSSSEERF